MGCDNEARRPVARMRTGSFGGAHCRAHQPRRQTTRVSFTLRPRGRVRRAALLGQSGFQVPKSVAIRIVARPEERRPLRAAFVLDILKRMRAPTSVRVTKDTRDAVKELADADGLSMDQVIARLARAERQRRIGLALVASPVNDDELEWLGGAARSVAEPGGW